MGAAERLCTFWGLSSLRSDSEAFHADRRRQREKEALQARRKERKLELQVQQQRALQAKQAAVVQRKTQVTEHIAPAFMVDKAHGPWSAHGAA